MDYTMIYYNHNFNTIKYSNGLSKTKEGLIGYTLYKY